MCMKKILYITAFPPNQQSAGQNYSRQFLNELSKCCEVDLIYFQYRDHEISLDPDVHVVESFKLSTVRKCFNIMKLPFFHPFFTARFEFSLLLYINKNKSKYDIIYFDFSQVFIYSLFIKHPGKVLMSHDVIYQKYLRNDGFVNRIMRPLLECTERALYKSAYKIFCFSKKDRQLINTRYGFDAVTVPFYLDEKIRTLSYETTDLSDYFLFYGAWNRKENSDGLYWFLKNVYPFVESVRLKIIGPALPEEIMDIVIHEENIEYCGFVDDPYKYLMYSKALIAPIFKGAGVKVKVIETLATGTPVIGTDIAFEGIDDVGDECMPAFYLANTAKAFIVALNSFPVINREDKQYLYRNFMHSYNENKAIHYLLH